MTNKDKSLDEIIGQMAGAVSMCWEPTPTGVFDSSHARKYVEEASAQINNYIKEQMLSLIGEDLIVDDEDEEMATHKTGHNCEKAKARKAINERFK